ncbi:MAG: DALR domain-containing protein, partial [Gammaproteobacteria bacterium]
RSLDAPPVKAPQTGDSPAWQTFHAAMDDDFNTPEAIAVLQAVAGEINRARDAGDVAGATAKARELRAIGSVLGLLTLNAEDWFKASKGQSTEGGWDDARIEAAIAERQDARKSKNFKRSDEIRDELAAAGIVLEDKPGGATVWRRS